MNPCRPRIALAALVAGIVAGTASAFAQSAEHAMPGMAQMGGAATGIVATPVAGPNQVVIANFAFGPATLTVPRGTTVTWINQDGDAHTVTAVGDKPLFKSPPLDTGDSYTFTFKDAGTYPYFCAIHPSMKGTVVVQ